jgi:YesN/AraC family two-component response regulator
VSTPIRVAIVDDQAMIRAGFTSLLSAEPDIEVVGDAADGEAAVELVSRLAPDVALMDIRMPLLDGFRQPGAWWRLECRPRCWC